LNNELLNAIYELGVDRKIKTNSLQTIRDNREEATAFFLKRIDDMIDDPSLSDERLIEDSFFGIFFLAEWKEKAAFKKVQKILHLIGENTDAWLGDALTENLPAVMYQFYDDDFDNLVEAMFDAEMYSFSRSIFMDIIFQKYIDGEITKDKVFEVVHKLDNLPEEKLDPVLITNACLNMVKAHFYEYWPAIRRWSDEGWIDGYIAGDYPDYVDITFEYRREDKEYVRKDYSLEKELHKWYEVEGWENIRGNLDRDFSNEEYNKLFEEELRLRENPYANVGRNDPCPCGSGKKFKKCHYLTIDAMDNGIEKNRIRDRHLEYYPSLSFNPETGADKESFERQEGRLYLEDLFERDSITIDYYVYLAFKQDQRGFWTMRPDSGDNEKQRIKIAYLLRAKALYDEKMKKENLKSAKEFDEKYSIHYFTNEWIGLVENV
jgi:hypothetical protein